MLTNGDPEKIAMDNSGANYAAVDTIRKQEQEPSEAPPLEIILCNQQKP